MTTLTEPIVTTALRRAAVRATRAPSVHNTQPWQLTVSPTSLELRADFDRRLRVLDPHGRQLLLSCGCALLNARAALAESNVVPAVQRLPYAGQPDLLARRDIRPTASEIVVPEPNLAYLASAPARPT